MKLIILAGENHSGKTTILKALTTALQLKGAKLSKSTHVGNSDEDEEYELYYCGHKVVICTLGDYSDNLNNHCEQYKSADMLICATRKAFRKTNYTALSYDDMSTIILINPCKAKQQKQNSNVVDYLLQVIKSRLNH